MEDGFLPDENRRKHHDEAKRQTIAGFFVVFGVAMLVLAGTWLPRTIAIRSGSGVYGTYTVGDPSLQCNVNDSCSLYGGTFRSDDGRVVVTSAQVAHPSRTQVQAGDTIRAFHVGGNFRVYTEADRDAVPMPQIFVTVVGLVGIVHGSLMFWRARKARKPGA